jgi:hypothetical protein
MTSAGIVAALALATTAFTTSAQAAAVNFSDNFDTGASPDWSNSTGNWVASGGVYLAQNPNNNPYAATFLPFNVGDYTLTVNSIAIADSGIFLRSDGTGNNGILLVLGGANYGQGGRGGDAGTSLYFHTIQGGVTSAPIDVVNNAFITGDTYAIKVIAAGDTYSVYVNGTEVDTLTSTLFTSGQVGLYDDQPNVITGSGSGTPSAFDDFTLKTPAAVPEPATWITMIGGIGMAGTALRRSKPRTASA